MKPSLWKLALVVAVLAPVQAGAQFTAVVTPPPAEADAPASVETRARVDSADRAQLTDLRTWVDSAASVVASASPAPTIVDSAAPAAPVPAAVPQQTTEFRDGARAPDTATSLPLLLALGSLLFASGLALLLRRAPAAPARGRRPPRA